MHGVLCVAPHKIAAHLNFLEVELQFSLFILHERKIAACRNMQQCVHSSILHCGVNGPQRHHTVSFGVFQWQMLIRGAVPLIHAPGPRKNFNGVFYFI